MCVIDQYGKIDDYDLSRGDFVFRTLRSNPKVDLPPPLNTTPPPSTKMASSGFNTGIYENVKKEIKPPRKKNTAKNAYIGTGLFLLSVVRVELRGQIDVDTRAVGKYAHRETLFPITVGYGWRRPPFKLVAEFSYILSSDILSSDIQGFQSNLFIHRLLGNRFSVFAYIGVNRFESKSDAFEFYKETNETCDFNEKCKVSFFPAGGLGLHFYFSNRISFRGEYFRGTLMDGFVGSALAHF